MKFFRVNGKRRVAYTLAVVALAAFFVWRLVPGDFLAPWRSWIERVLEEVRHVPFLVFIPLAGILPLAGVPMTALYLAAGAVYSPVYGLPLTLAGIAASLVINMLLSYAVARVFRGPAHRLLGKWGLKMPTFSGTALWKVILMVRITPGAPLVAQNLLLGLAGVPVGLYLAVSMPAEILIALGYMTAGRSFATGQWGFLFLGIGIVGVSALAISLLRDRRKMLGAGTEGD
jgi:uncharacterized membrane protein YdjX (TVP38/TMEM64 family)